MAKETYKTKNVKRWKNFRKYTIREEKRRIRRRKKSLESLYSNCSFVYLRDAWIDKTIIFYPVKTMVQIRDNYTQKLLKKIALVWTVKSRPKREIKGMTKCYIFISRISPFNWRERCERSKYTLKITQSMNYETYDT